MQSLFQVVLVLLLGAAMAHASEEQKARPVSKVITLLKDMQKQLEKEAEEDEELYDKMACWCETNDKEKSQAIQDAEAHITDLTTRIEEHTASSARLSQEITNLDKEVASNQQALDTATSIRQKELGVFNGEEKDLLQSIGALGSAITVLSKHNSALVQVPRTHLLGVAAMLQKELSQHSQLLLGVITPSERELVHAFIQAPSYAPQSGEIFGILRQMKETFESDLSQSQKDELASQKAFEDLKAAKSAEISAGQAQIDTKTQESAATVEKLAQSKQDIEDTRNSLSADEEFLMMLKEKCAMTDSEWEARQKTRNTEIEAVSKALAILSSDDAHDTFTSTFNPALLQEGALVHSDRRARASKMLSAAATRLHNPRLATLAVKVRLDAFVRVIKAIDDMVAQLTKDKADEIKHKDFCVEEFNSNQLTTEKKEREKEDFIAKIEDETMTIDTLTKEIAALNAEIAELQVQLKRAGEDREKQNQEFQAVVADQRATQKLLQAALGVLKDVYGSKKGASLVQGARQAPAGPPPPAGFDTYKKSGGAGGVLGMIQQIISDAQAMEAETIRSEEDAQKAYEDFVKDTNNSVETKNKDIVNKSQVKAKTETDLVKSKEGKESTMVELEQLSNYEAELHSSCDFVTKNFEIRQTARDEEIEALKQAKAILSGANFGAFLQA